MAGNEDVRTDELMVEIILESRSIPIRGEVLDITLDSPPGEILGRLAPVVRESEGIDILDNAGDSMFVVRKMADQNKIFIYPKGTAG